MSTLSLNINYTIVQGDIFLIDRSRTTTNMDSFNVMTTTLTSQSTEPEFPLGMLFFLLLPQELG